MLSRGATAPAHDVEPSLLGIATQEGSHPLRRVVVQPHLVGKPGVRIAVDPQGGDSGDLLEVRLHLLCSQGAVQPDAEKVGVADGDPGRLQGLSREGPAAGIGDRKRRQHRHAQSRLVEGPMDGEERRLEVQRVEGGLGQEQIHPPGEQGPGLLVIGPLQLDEGDRAETGAVHVGGEGSGAVRGAHGPGHEARAVRVLRGKGVGGATGNLGGGLVDREDLLLQSVIGQGDGGRIESVRLDQVRAGG